MVVRSIGVLSAGKIMGVMYALLGLIAGAFMALVSMAGLAANAPPGGNPLVPFAAVGAGAVILLPIMYGVFGFVIGIISAAVYNVIAGIVGGIELDFERPSSPVATQ